MQLLLSLPVYMGWGLPPWTKTKTRKLAALLTDLTVACKNTAAGVRWPFFIRAVIIVHIICSGGEGSPRSCRADGSSFVCLCTIHITHWIDRSVESGLIGLMSKALSD